MACSGASTCVAVGRLGGNDGQVVPLGISSSGTLTPTGPDAVPGTGALFAVACPGGGVCVAAGQNTSGTTESVAITVGAAGSITVSTSPQELVGTPYYLFAVTCPTPGSCLGVGYDIDTGVGLVVPLTIATSGAITPGTPEDAPGTYELTAVACATTATCVAVGFEQFHRARRHRALYRDLGRGDWWVRPWPLQGPPTSASLLAPAPPFALPPAASQGDRSPYGLERDLDRRRRR